MATSLFIYSLISGSIMTLLWLTFRLTGLRRLTHYRLTRIVLLSILTLSALLPFAAFVERPQKPATTTAPVIVITETDSTPTLAPTTEASTPATAPDHGPKLPRVLPVIYLGGAALAAAWLLLGLVNVACAIMGGKRRKIGPHTTLVVHSREIKPFSWGKWIVIAEYDLESNGSMLLSHEKAHLAAAHWTDLLLARLVGCITWYWPTAWLLTNDLAEVHEFEADSRVLASGASSSDYQMLLISKAAGISFIQNGITNPFNYHSLKNRITMMQKSISPARSRMRALALLPAAALVILLSSSSALASTVSRYVQVKSTSSTVTPITDSVRVIERKVRGADATEILYVINGIIATTEEYESLAPEQVLHISVNHTQEVIDTYGEQARNGVIEITTKNAPEEMQQKVAEHLKNSEGLVSRYVQVKSTSSTVTPITDSVRVIERKVRGADATEILYVINGIIATTEEYESLAPEQVLHISVNHTQAAIDTYGEQARNGVIEITTKNAPEKMQQKVAEHLKNSEGLTTGHAVEVYTRNRKTGSAVKVDQKQ